MPIINSTRGVFGAVSISSGGAVATVNVGNNVPFPSSSGALQTQYFSPGYFGVETSNTYIIPNGYTVDTVHFKRLQTTAYHWWFTINTKSNNTYTPIYAAVIPVSSGGSVGDTVSFNLNNATIFSGNRTIPITGTHYIGWHSGTGGYAGLTETSGKIYADVGDTTDADWNVFPGSGSISWVYAPSTVPAVGTSWSASTVNVRSGISIAVTCSKKVNNVPILDGSSIERAAISARAIKTLTGTTTDGWYWIKPTGWTTPRYVYCDMNSNGGGWMLMAWQSTQMPNYWAVGDAEYNSYSNGGATTIFQDVTASSSGGNQGNRFINNIVVNNRNACVFAYNTSNDGNTFYFNTDSNSEYLPFFLRNTHSKNAASRNGNENLAGNTWLKTCWTGYSTSGGSGAGQATGGTQISHGNERWGTFPYNMINTYSGNWGSAIDPYYETNSVPNNLSVTRVAGQWNSAHNAGWGQSIAIWVKI